MTRRRRAPHRARRAWPPRGRIALPPAAARRGRAEAPPTLDELRWVARPLVVFADTPDDPRFEQQAACSTSRIASAGERDVVVLTDAAPDAPGPLRQRLRPRGFGVVLIDVDGTGACAASPPSRRARSST